MVRLNYAGEELLIRQVTIELFKPTRNGEKEVEVLTRLSTTEATAAVVAQLYIERRSVENLFQTVTENYEGEIQTLGYPQAALFSFGLALVTYNVLATIRAVVASVHGVGKIEAGLSDYYMVDEIQSTYRGMMIAIPSENWRIFTQCDRETLGNILLDLAGRVDLKRFLKNTRATKKKKSPPYCDARHRHVSTSRLLDRAQQPP